MKYGVFFLLLLNCICLSQVHKAGKIKIGIKAGATASQIKGDGFKGFHKFGFVGGAMFQLQLDKKYTGNIEVLFVQKGVRNDGTAQNYFNLYHVDFSYVEIPVIFSYRYKRCSFGFGPGIGLIIRQHEVDYRNNSNDHNSFKTQDVNLNADFNCILNKNLSFSCRYTNSIIPIRSNPSGKSYWYDPWQQNQTFALSLNYRFLKLFNKEKISDENNTL